MQRRRDHAASPGGVERIGRRGGRWQLVRPVAQFCRRAVLRTPLLSPLIAQPIQQKTVQRGQQESAKTAQLRIGLSEQIAFDDLGGDEFLEHVVGVGGLQTPAQHQVPRKAGR